MKGVIKAGRLVLISSGCYSDYSVHSAFVTLKPVPVQEELTAWLVNHPEQIEDYSFEEHQFLVDLIAKGYLLEVNVAWLHLGDYHRASEV